VVSRIPPKTWMTVLSHRRQLATIVHPWRALSGSLDCRNFANCILRGFPCLDHDVIRSDLRTSSGITDTCTNSDDRHHGNERDQRNLELSRSIRSQKRIIHRRFLTLTALPRPAAYDLVQRSVTRSVRGRRISSGLIERAMRFVWQHNHFCAHIHAAVEVDYVVVEHADATA